MAQPQPLFDSTAEQLFSDRHPNLVRDNSYLPCIFTEINVDEGATKPKTFNAKADFRDLDTRTIIEFKCRQLNYMKTQKQADKQFTERSKFSKNTAFINLECGWNHSVYKHAAVAKMLKELGYKYLIIFTDDTTLTTQARNKMKSLDIQWCYESDYFA